MHKKIYISTSIPYVNARPHIGYALEAVQTDAFARFYRQHGAEVYFVSGTDDNAIKNVESAAKAGITTKEFVDQNAEAFFQLQKALNLSFDFFIRTSSVQHVQGAQKFWELCAKDIYKKTYSGLYCVGCEAFYKEGHFPDDICPEHNRKLERIEEENYFFSLSKYVDQVKALIETGKLEILPEFRKKELLQFIDEGIEDISVSRPKERTKGWGIPVPGDAPQGAQHMYVWFDALTNYITALNFGTSSTIYKKFWEENENRYHVIGKNIVKFHGLYWPAMLLSAGLPVPKRLYSHGFITIGGQKMSKSLGNVIDPFEVQETYGTDALRYYLLREIPSLDDGEYSPERMQQLYESDLANELGNSVLRVTTIAEKDGIEIPQVPQKDTGEETATFIEQFQFNQILENVWKEIKHINKEIDEFAPWQKQPDERKEFLETTLLKLNVIGFHLEPFLPATAAIIQTSTTGKITKPAPLFPRR
jgi:methionyl-tRNA synthetase